MSEERFKSKSKEIEIEINNLKEQLDDIQIELIDYDGILEYGRYFLRNISKLWISLDSKSKRSLQDILFPEGLIVQNSSFRTTIFNLILRLFSDKKCMDFNPNANMVGPPGFEPGTSAL